MTNEIEDEITELMEEHKHYDITYDDGKTSNPKEYEDDCFIHISRGKYRFVFYNGQDRGQLGEKDIPRLKKFVDERMKKHSPEEKIIKCLKFARFQGGGQPLGILVNQGYGEFYLDTKIKTQKILQKLKRQGKVEYFSSTKVWYWKEDVKTNEVF